MLTVSKITHSAGAANYYEEKDNYYFNGTDNTQWYGTGATTLGLQGNVSKTDFIPMLNGKLPNGSSLTHLAKGKNSHRAGYDFTFSAPKSVSVLALVAEDKKVLEAHKNAVTKALTEIELMTSTRTMHQGITNFEHTGNLIAALFLHDTSRNLDPQLHTHAVIANATQNQQGEWKTLSSDRQMGQGFVEVTWNNQVALGALYRQFLKEDLKQQGYQIITAGKNGQWEIKGVPTEPFSSRRKEIIEAIGEKASAKQKTVATLDTRQKKDFSNIEAVRQEWKLKLQQSGFDKNSLTQPLTAEKPDPQQKITAQQAIQAAINQLEIYHSKFTYDKLLTQIINQLPFESGMINKLRTEISQFIEQGNLIPINKNSTVLTSANQLKQENAVAQLISTLNEKQSGLRSTKNSALITNIVKNGADINLVNLKGDASHQLNALMDIDTLAKENGRQHIIIVPNITSKKNLAAEMASNIPIMTLKDMAQPQPKVEKTIFSLYQSEKIELADMQPLLERVNQQNATAIIFDSGIGAQTGLTKAIANNLEITEITCQQANTHKQLYFIEQVDKHDRPQLAANYYCRLYASNKQAIIQTGNQKLNTEITNKTRQTLIDRGLLSQQSISVLNKKSIFLDAANRNSRNTYRAGNQLEKTTGAKKEIFIIKEVDKETNTLLLFNSDQRYTRLAINKISPDYKLYQTEALELRIGDKVKSLATFGKNIQGGKTFTITKLKPGNFLFRDSITMEDSNGNRVSFTNKTETKLDYHYCESLGKSFSRTKTVIAITNDRELNNTTINQIKHSGKTVIAITGHDKTSIDKKIALNDVKMQTISKDNIDLANPSNSAQFTLDTDLKKAIDIAIDHVTGSQVFFNGAAAITKTFQLLPHSSFKQIATEFEKRVTQGDFIAVDGSLNTLMGNFLAKTSFDREVMILKHLLAGKNSQPSLIKSNQPITTEGLMPGQQKAAEKILRSPDQIIAIQGYAGVGKTTQFKTVANALKHNRPDITLTGLAPTHKAVAELKAAGINSQTIASFLNENNRTTSFKNSLFIIDESSMIGNKTYSTLLNNIAGQGGRIVLAGDRQQLKSFESGVPFKLTLERSAADTVVMREIVRQTPALKPAIEAVIAGNIKQSLAVIASIPPTTVSRNRKSDLPTHSVIDLKEKEPDEKITAIVNDFTSRTKDALDNTLIVTSLNRDRKVINEAIHQTLYHQEQQSLTIPILQRINHQPADLKMTEFWQANSDNIAKINQTYYTIGDISSSGTLALEQADNHQERYLSVMELNPNTVTLFQPDNITVNQGEKIRLTLTDKERLASNNETGIIKKISGNSLLIDFNGQELKYNPIQEMTDRHLDYTYAVTAYASQGASVPYVIVYDGASDNKAKLAALDNTYVEFSRSKAHVQVYLDDAEKWIKHIENHSGERLTAHELIKRHDDQLAASEKNLWQQSKQITQTALAKKIAPVITDTGRLNTMTKSPEILLPVVNENGIQRGNYHLPVGIYSGNLDFNNGTYQGADDGKYIILQKGDENSEPKTYQADQLQSALQQTKPEQAIVIEIHSHPDNNSEDKTINKITTEELEAESKALSVEINQLALKDENNLTLDEINNEKTIAIPSLSLSDEEILIKDETEIEKEIKRLDSDEVNILHHKSPEKTKQKEYGD